MRSGLKVQRTSPIREPRLGGSVGPSAQQLGKTRRSTIRERRSGRSVPSPSCNDRAKLVAQPSVNGARADRSRPPAATTERNSSLAHPRTGSGRSVRPPSGGDRAREMRRSVIPNSDRTEAPRPGDPDEILLDKLDAERSCERATGAAFAPENVPAENRELDENPHMRESQVQRTTHTVSGKTGADPCTPQHPSTRQTTR
jgi:hypothetical protein